MNLDLDQVTSWVTAAMLAFALYDRTMGGLGGRLRALEDGLAELKRTVEQNKVNHHNEVEMIVEKEGRRMDGEISKLHQAIALLTSTVESFKKAVERLWETK